MRLSITDLRELERAGWAREAIARLEAALTGTPAAPPAAPGTPHAPAPAAAPDPAADPAPWAAQARALARTAWMPPAWWHTLHRWGAAHRRPLIRLAVAILLLLAVWEGWRRHRLLLAALGAWAAQGVGLLAAPWGWVAGALAGLLLLWHARGWIRRWGPWIVLVAGVGALLHGQPGAW
jgi:hypothetical protein